MSGSSGRPGGELSARSQWSTTPVGRDRRPSAVPVSGCLRWRAPAPTLTCNAVSGGSHSPRRTAPDTQASDPPTRLARTRSTGASIAAYQPRRTRTMAPASQARCTDRGPTLLRSNSPSEAMPPQRRSTSSMPVTRQHCARTVPASAAPIQLWRSDACGGPVERRNRRRSVVSPKSELHNDTPRRARRHGECRQKLRLWRQGSVRGSASRRGQRCSGRGQRSSGGARGLLARSR